MLVKVSEYRGVIQGYLLSLWLSNLLMAGVKWKRQARTSNAGVKMHVDVTHQINMILFSDGTIIIA